MAKSKKPSDPVAAELKKRDSGPDQYERGSAVEGGTPREDTLKRHSLPEGPKK